MVTVTDVRCPGCGKKLAEWVGVTVGEVRLKCDRCKRLVSIKA